MNCLYCNHNIDPTDDSQLNGLYECKYCTFPVRYLYHGSISNPELGYTQFDVNGYLIELDHFENQCELYKQTSPLHSIFVLSINYLPPITPATAEDWLERLLNLKAFS